MRSRRIIPAQCYPKSRGRRYPGVVKTMLALLCLSSIACATIDQSRMSDGCKVLYKSCMNSCPNENARQADVPTSMSTSPAGQSLGTTPNTTPVSNKTQRDAQSCSEECADRARTCE